jgi:hypothetical protein
MYDVKRGKGEGRGERGEGRGERGKMADPFHNYLVYYSVGNVVCHDQVEFVDFVVDLKPHLVTML